MIIIYNENNIQISNLNIYNLQGTQSTKASE